MFGVYYTYDTGSLVVNVTDIIILNIGENTQRLVVVLEKFHIGFGGIMTEFEYDIDLDLATINRQIEYKKTIDPYYDPEHARERKAKFYKYQRYERKVNHVS